MKKVAKVVAMTDPVNKMVGGDGDRDNGGSEKSLDRLGLNVDHL